MSDEAEREAERPEGWRPNWRPPRKRRDTPGERDAANPRYEPAPLDAPAELDHEAGKALVAQRKEALAGLVPLAVQRLAAELRGDYGADLAHDSARYVLDQALGRAVQAQVTKSESEVNVGEELLRALSIAESASAEFARNLRGQVVEAEVKELTVSDVGSSGDHAPRVERPPHQDEPGAAPPGEPQV